MLTYKNLKNLKKKLIPLKSTVGPLTGSKNYSDPRGDFKGGICYFYDGNDSRR